VYTLNSRMLLHYVCHVWKCVCVITRLYVRVQVCIRSTLGCCCSTCAMFHSYVSAMTRLYLCVQVCIRVSAGVHTVNARALLQYMCHVSFVCVCHDSCVCLCVCVGVSWLVCVCVQVCIRSMPSRCCRASTGFRCHYVKNMCRGVCVCMNIYIYIYMYIYIHI